MGNPENVGVAEIKVSDDASILASYGLGSCIAIAMYDPVKKVGGLAHVMLPRSQGREPTETPGKFADTAVVKLLDELISMGATHSRIRCKVVGGSQMFEVLEPELAGPAHIGARNVEAVKEALIENKIKLVGEDTGGNYGRTVRFDTGTGEIEVTSIYHGRTVI